MKVIFFHIGPDVSMPTWLAQSIIKHGHEAIFLTDKKTADIPGCETHRYEYHGENIVWFRMQCYAKYNQEGIYLDSDMLVMRNLEPIMALDFEIALTKVKHKIIDSNGVNISELMPYNGGFIAMKDKTFLPDMVKHVERTMAESNKPELKDLWYCDQMSLAQMAKTRNLIELPVYTYNKTIKRPGLDTSGAWVIHFKGKGKAVMETYLD